MATEKPFYKSNKFWYAVGGVAVVFVGHFTGMSIEELGVIAGIVVMLIGGQSAADFGKHAKAVEAEANKFSELSGQIKFFQGLQNSADILDDDQKAKVKETTNRLLEMATLLKK